MVLSLATGDSEARDLFALVYEELRRLASVHLLREREGHTLQPTALVHEAYLRISAREGVPVDGRDQFLAVAAQAMRRVLIDHARRRQRDKRTPRPGSVALAAGAGPSGPAPIDVLILEELLQKFARLDPRAARVVELRIFGGLGLEETARILGVTDRTVRSDWSVARAWLARELDGGPDAGPP